MINKEKIHTLSINILGIYFLLLPVDSALGNIVGSISLINYFAIIYVMLRTVEILLIDKKIIIKEFKKNVYILLYALYYIISIFFRQSQTYNTFFVFSLIISFSVFFFAVTDKYKNKDIKKLKKYIFYSIISILLSVLFMSDFFSENGRLSLNASKSMDPNFFAIGLSLLTSLLFNNIIKNNKRISSIVGIIFIFTIIILTGSRSGLISNFCVIIVAFLFTNISKIKKIIIITFLLLFATMFVLNISKIVPEEILNRFSINQLEKDSGSGRFQIWENGINIYMNNTVMRELFGTGAGTYQYIVLPQRHAAHNVYIQTLFEGGLVNLTILIIALSKGLLYSLKTKNYIAFSAMIGLITGGIGIDINITRIFWICLFLIHCNKNISENIGSEIK